MKLGWKKPLNLNYDWRRKTAGYFGISTKDEWKSLADNEHNDKNNNTFNRTFFNPFTKINKIRGENLWKT